MRVLMPLPDQDFDVTEVAVPWRLPTDAGHEVCFATEFVAALDDPSRFQLGPRVATARGTATEDGPAFVVEDGSYVSARWPGDAYLFAKRFIAKLSEVRP